MKKLNVLFVLFGGLWSLSIHANVGFSEGDVFTNNMARGQLSIECNDYREGYRVTYANCETHWLAPVEYDFLVSNENIDADNVQLISRWETGKERKKTIQWETAEGRSSETVNLWIETLFQRRLLSLGNNQITYKFLKSQNVVKEGVFTVKVEQGQDLTCPDARMYSRDINDCRNTLNSCRRYFRHFNYCRP